MAFDGTKAVDLTWSVHGDSVRLRWTSTATPGAVFQVYVDRVLTWYGDTTTCLISHPSGQVSVDVGAVGAGEAGRDFSGSLPAVPGGGRRVRVEWEGSAALSPTLLGFHVYIGATPGTDPDLDSEPDVVPFDPAADGFGLGGFGGGWFGFGGGVFTWTSPPRASGAWVVWVYPYDETGDVGAAVEFTVTVVAPPEPPARDAAGLRLVGSYDPVTGDATLSWIGP